MDSLTKRDVSDDLKDLIVIAFSQLHPLCTQLNSASLSLKDEETILKEILDLLPKLPAVGIARCLEFTLFPLLSILKRDSIYLKEAEATPSLCIELVLKIVDDVLQISNSQNLMENWSFSMFSQILHHIALLFPYVTSASTIQLNEDSKYLLVKCLHHLFANTRVEEKETIEKLVPPSLLAYIISALIELSSEKEKSRPLRILSISTLKEICVRFATRKTVAIFLPGIVSALTKVITGDYKQGHKIVSTAFDTLTEIVVIVLNDKDNGSLISHANVSLDPLSSLRNFKPSNKEDQMPEILSQDSLESPLDQNLNKSWLRSTCLRMKQIFSIVFSTSKEHSYHSKWKVRMAQIESAIKIVKNCMQTLQETSLTYFIDILAFHLNDEYPQVSSTSRSGLSYLAHSNQLSFSLISAIKENLYKIFNSLPRLARGTNETETLMSMKLIIGYICLLGTSEDMNTLIQSSLSHLALALYQILDFDIYDIRKEDSANSAPYQLIKDSSEQNVVTVNSPRTETQSGYPKKIFKHFRDEKLKMYLSKVCRLLGYYSDPMFTVDYFLNVIQDRNMSRYTKQAVFVLNEIILGCAGIGIEEEIEVSKDPFKTNTVLTPGNILNVNQEIIVANWLQVNKIQIKLTANQAGSILDAYSAPEFWNLPTTSSGEKQLTIEKLNDNILLLSLLLEGIGNVAQVVKKQFDDYLITILYPLTEKLGDPSSIVSHSSWTTLQVISENCKYESVADLVAKNTDYLIDTIIRHLRHLREYPNTPQVMKGILMYADESILLVLEDTLDSVFSTLDEHSNSEFTLTFINILHAIVLVFYKQLNSTAKDLPPTDDLTKLRNLRHAFLLQIMEKAQFFMGFGLRDIKLQILDILCKGLPVVASVEEGGLLPLIHTLWSPLTKRFRDSDKVVVMKALEVVEVMAQLSKEFLTGKISTDLWPVLHKLLVDAGKDKPENISIFTQDFKLKKTVLRCLSVVFKYVKISDVVTLEAIRSTKIFLSSKQPEELQQLTVELFKELSILNGDAVWFILHEILGSSFKHPNMKSLSIAQTGDSSYVENVNIILNQL